MTEVKSEIKLDIADVKRSLDDIIESVEYMIESMSQDHTKIVKEIDEKKDALAGMKKAFKDVDVEMKTHTAGFSDYLKKLAEFGTSYKQVVAEMRRDEGIKGIVGEALPSQLDGMKDGVSKFRQSLLSELPFGGLIGLMILGGKREEEVRAATTNATRMFQQSGQLARTELTELSGSIRGVGIMLGKGPTGLSGEFASSIAAFAQGGVDFEDVMKNKFELPIRGSKGSIVETSVAIDSLFKQSAGTSARQMTTLIKDFNMGASESAKVVASIGLAARDSGTSVQVFTESVMRSAQALRTQRIDIREVADAQLKFQKILSEQMPDISPQFAAGYAERAMSQVTQGLAGMSVGLSAVLGERISARRPDLTGGQQASGLGAYYAIREGFAGQGQGEGSGMFAESVKELISLAKENGRTVEEQRFFLEKMGFGFEGSKALISLSEKDLASNENLAKAIENNKNGIRDAFVDRAKEQSGILRGMQKAQDGIAKIGFGLLGTIINGLHALITVISNIGVLLSLRDSPEKQAAMEKIDLISGQATKSINYLLSGVNETMSGIKDASGVFLRVADTDPIDKKYGIGKYKNVKGTTEEIDRRPEQVKRALSEEAADKQAAAYARKVAKDLVESNKRMPSAPLKDPNIQIGKLEPAIVDDGNGSQFKVTGTLKAEKVTNGRGAETP